jgi:hypothetical protein
MTKTTKEPNKSGRTPDKDIFFDRFGDLCKYKVVHGMLRAPRTNAGKNQPLTDWVHYIRKRKARDELAAHYVVALNGINFEWTTGQSPRGQFKVRFAELEEFKNNHGTVFFSWRGQEDPPKLTTWTAYAKSMAIKVLTKMATSSVFTLPRIKKGVDLGLVTSSFYKYGPEEEEYEDADEADAAIYIVVVLLVNSNNKAMMTII